MRDNIRLGLERGQNLDDLQMKAGRTICNLFKEKFFSTLI
jgi:hypothetical protein